MDPQIKKKLAATIVDFHLPRYCDLPDVGLYLDQVVRYVNRFTTLCDHNEITPSMVSNYTKQKIIPGPDKKAYGADSIAYLLFIAYTKMVVQMEDIRLMIDIQKGSYSTAMAYDYFCEEFENLLQFAYGLKPQPDYIGHENTAQKELLRSALLSITYKIYLEHYVQLLRETYEVEAQTEQDPEMPL